MISLCINRKGFALAIIFKGVDHSSLFLFGMGVKNGSLF